jgi:hypothetical protein
MDLVIELDHQGRICLSAADGTAAEEAWVLGADDTSTTLDPQEIVAQLWVNASYEL